VSIAGIIVLGPEFSIRRPFVVTSSLGWREEEGTEGGTSCFLLNGKATFDSYLEFEVAVFDITDVGSPLLSYEGCATASSSLPSSGEDVTNRLLGRRRSGEADAVRFVGNAGVTKMHAASTRVNTRYRNAVGDARDVTRFISEPLPVLYLNSVMISASENRVKLLGEPGTHQKLCDVDQQVIGRVDDECKQRKGMRRCP